MGKEGVYSVPVEIDHYAALECLRAGVEGRNTEGLATLEGHVFEQHPWELPPCFFLREPPLSRGNWKEDCRVGIRRKGPSPTPILDLRPCYIGMKTYLEFQRPDGIKSGWLMVEYRLFEHRSTVVSTVDDLVLCKVFQQKLKGLAPSGDAAAQLPNQVPLHPTRSSSSPTNPETPFDVNTLFGDFGFNDHHIGVPGPFSGHTGLSIDDYAAQGLISWGPPSSGREGQHWQNKEPVVPNDVQGMRKRSRSSGNDEPKKLRSVWEDFTKINTKYPMVVYAACHYCDRMYKAHSQRDGRSHLRRHTATCSCKMHLHQPSQVLCHSVDRGEGDTAALAPMLGGNQQASRATADASS